ncbi:MAG: cytosolic protein [Leptospiraceae bacterium]|nr:cytosolic protein [Leptospiraceae bacterium]
MIFIYLEPEMNNALDLEDIKKYIEENINNFHQRRLEKLRKLNLKKVLKRKNIYMLRAKNILTFQDFVKSILDSFLSSQEETIFGELLEGLAVFVCSQVYNGIKSSAEGIDLEFEKESIKYIVSIKSGPNWGNSSQIKKMKDQFQKAKKILGTNRSKVNIVAVNGCCYGRDNKPDKGDYLKLCGQRFWEFISGDSTLYTDIVKPLGFKAKEENEEFLKAYSQILNQFSIEFGKDFSIEGSIDWEKLVRYTSSKVNL